MLSFSLDFSGVMTTVSSLVNGLFPIYLLPVGIVLGIGILTMLGKAFKSITQVF